MEFKGTIVDLKISNKQTRIFCNLNECPDILKINPKSWWIVDKLNKRPMEILINSNFILGSTLIRIDLPGNSFYSKYKIGEIISLYVDDPIITILNKVLEVSYNIELIEVILNRYYIQTPELYQSVIRFSLQNQITYILDTLSEDSKRIMNIALNTNHRM